MANLNPILAQAASFQELAQESSDEMTDLYDQLRTINMQDARTQESIGTNLGVIEGAQKTSEMETQHQKLRRANQLGIDPSAQDDILSNLGAQYKQARAEQEAAGLKIKEKQSVGLFENPLLHIINKLTVNDDIAKHNAALDDALRIRQEFFDLNQMTQTTNLTTQQLAQPITQATIDATVQNTALQAKLLADQSTKAGITNNQQGIQSALSMKSEVLHTSFSVLGAQQAQEHINIALANAERERQQFEWKKDEKAMDRATAENMWAVVLKGRQLRFAPGTDPLANEDVNSPNVRNIIGMMRGNSPAAKEYNDDYQAGQNGILSSSPSHSLDILKARAVALNPAQGEVRNLLEHAYELVPATTLQSKDPAAIKAAVDANTRGLVDQMLRKVVPGDRANIFNIPSTAFLINNSPELQKLPFVQKVLQPRMALGDPLSDPGEVFTAALEAVYKGDITYNESQLGIAALYQRGVQTNLAARNLVNFGITAAKENNMFQYNVEIPVNPYDPFGRRKIVDITKMDLIASAQNIWLAKKVLANPAPMLAPMKSPFASEFGVNR